MKIAFIVTYFPKISETFVLNQIIELINKGHQLQIYSDFKGYEPDCHIEIKQYNLIEQTYYLLQNMPLNKILRLVKGFFYLTKEINSHSIILLRSLNFIEFHKYALNFKLLYSLIALRQAQNHNFDIVHAQFGTSGIKTMMLRKYGYFKGKFIVSFRGSDISKNLEKKKYDYNKLFNEVDLLLPVSEYFKQKLINLGCDKSKIKVHRSGINCKKFSYTLRTPPADGLFELVSVGRLIEKKGFEYGLKALKIMLERNYKINYKIIGDGPLMDYLKNLSTQLEIHHNVVFYGRKNHNDIWKMLNKSHILIAPSVTAKNGDQEGIPNVLKEAMAMGIPVISTYHSGIPELIEDGVSGFLVEERNENILAKKIELLINNPELWESMGETGRQIVEKDYNNETQNDKLVEIYSALIGDLHSEKLCSL
jgi:colanic acid/amylovoran biosynthesis glycosyltransferase